MQKVRGPAAFPSSENLRKPVAHWFKLLDAEQDRTHMEQVAFIKAEHRIGHGHANVLVACHQGQQQT